MRSNRSPRSGRDRFGRRLWRASWPKLVALGIILLVWEIAVWVHWKPYILQSPSEVASQLWHLLGTSSFWQSCWITAQQALIGFALVVLIGGAVGTAVARVPVLRAGIGSLITGMQTLPSVLWYPLAIMVFGVTSKAIILMMVLGAAPAVANGFISGIDQVPPGLVRAGRIIGARGLSLERHVVLPAAFPTILGGLKQGWAFGWHALMAGEFLVLVNPLSLGGRTVNADTQARVRDRRGPDDRDRDHRHPRGHGVQPCGPVGAAPLRPDRLRHRLTWRRPDRRQESRLCQNRHVYISAKVDYAVRALCTLADADGNRSPPRRSPSRRAFLRSSSRAS